MTVSEGVFTIMFLGDRDGGGGGAHDKLLLTFRKGDLKGGEGGACVC